jgi:hypothetical protein
VLLAFSWFGRTHHRGCDRRGACRFRACLSFHSWVCFCILFLLWLYLQYFLQGMKCVDLQLVKMEKPLPLGDSSCYVRHKEGDPRLRASPLVGGGRRGGLA